MNSGIQKAIQLLKQENEALKEENEALQAYMESMAALYRATRTIASQDNLMKLLDEILYQAIVITRADHGSLLLLDDETDELVFVMVHGDYRQSLQGYRMKADQGIAGWVVQHSEPLIVNHARFDPRFSSEVDRTFGLTTRKILAVPLTYADRTLGVIELVNKQDGSDFTDSDATILGLLGIFAAISLDQLDRRLEEEEKAAEAS